MSRLVGLLFTVCAALPAQQVAESTGIVTIFHEPAGNAIHMFSGKDSWPKRMHHKMLLDGKPLVYFHGDNFVSFRMPTGRHSIKFDTMGTQSADFDLQTDERVFVRPAMQFVILGEAHLLLSVVSCKEAVEAAQQSMPLEPKYIEGSGALPEAHFPATCEESPH